MALARTRSIKPYPREWTLPVGGDLPHSRALTVQGVITTTDQEFIGRRRITLGRQGGH